MRQRASHERAKASPKTEERELPRNQSACYGRIFSNPNRPNRIRLMPSPQTRPAAPCGHGAGDPAPCIDTERRAGGRDSADHQDPVTTSLSIR